MIGLLDRTAPCDWWRFAACPTCNSRRMEPCRKGGLSWPEEARRPHKARYRIGLELHSFVWLVRNHPRTFTDPEETR